MKKLFSILLVCVFAFSTVTFVGCGGDDAGSGDGAGDTAGEGGGEGEGEGGGEGEGE